MYTREIIRSFKRCERRGFTRYTTNYRKYEEKVCLKFNLTRTHDIFLYIFFLFNNKLCEFQVVVDKNNQLYKTALDLGIFYKYLNANVEGSYGKTKLSYVDFTNGKSVDWIMALKNYLEEKFGNLPHGIILTNNWLIDEVYVMDNSNIFPYWNDVS